MQPKESRIETHRAYEIIAGKFLAELQKQGVHVSVVGENGLRIKGEMTPEQKESVRLWKRQLINSLSPKCSNCTLPMKLIENGTLWFCPFGCGSLGAEK